MVLLCHGYIENVAGGGGGGASFADTFNRTNGDLSGSTSSDGLFTWSEPQGGEWEIVSNAAACVDIADETFSVAATSEDTDTDDAFAEFTITSWSVVGGLFVGLALRGNAYGAGGAGYTVEVGTDSGTPSNRMYLFNDDSTIDTDTSVDVSGGGTLRIEVSGVNPTLIRALWNGVEFMSANDSTHDGGAGNRKAAMVSFSNVAGNDVSIDNFSYGDL